MPFRIRSAADAKRFGASIAFLDQLDFARFECRVNVFATLSQLDDEFVKFGEPTFQFFQLDHHLGQVLVASLRCIANVQIARTWFVPAVSIATQIRLCLRR